MGRAASSPFSHELHLKLKLTCVKCHAKAAASTQLADNLLPAREACAGCHQQIDLRATPSATTLNRFNHQRHLGFGNLAPLLRRAVDSGAYLSPPGDMRRHLNGTNACEACHRGLAESKAVSKANFPAMADCLTCHNKIDPPWSCEQCHADGKALKPATHTANFIDLHNHKVNELGRATCAVCHGRKFSCLGCH